MKIFKILQKEENVKQLHFENTEQVCDVRIQVFEQIVTLVKKMNLCQAQAVLRETRNMCLFSVLQWFY